MRFNATKCYILSVKEKRSFFYQLNDTILQSVKNNPYLGLSISSDLKWGNHINNICKKANSTLGFIRRNLRHCPKITRKTAYIALVRSTLEYGAIIWDPYLQCDIDKIERVQRKAVRFISGDYQSRDTGCINKMLCDWELPTLQDRRKEMRLVFLFKVVEGLVPAIPPTTHLVPIRNKRKITAKKFENCVSKNIVESSQTNNNKCYRVPTSRTDIYRYSYFPRTIVDWNHLDDRTISAKKVEDFRSSLTK